MPNTDREEALFAAVLQKSTRAERAAYLDGACGGDQSLRERIEALLAAQEASGGVLDAPPSVLTPTSGYVPLTEGPGTIIGPYKLLQQIGEGGMGVVYMAEQQQPVRRKVALKIIKPGMDSHQVIARFEAERQALAMMDHQNIARVLDAGTTESGRPYFVMELVHGVPITQFCDDNKLTPRERLSLFVPVCQAIQHAHQKGVIHRDVKPSNVLVTMYDDRPVPKVIDFGVAKAIEQRLTERTMFTQFGALVGTFEYMSPEQAEMNAFGVDTRSDIYSLGVLLYELLTGTTPLERNRLREAALGEMVRMIREEEAPRPSLRLSSSNNLPKIAAARKTEPARLSKLVRGEIDWIVMKCLEKDRSRRYDTANAVARDLERYLADEPVEACPPSSSYRLRKFARKYKKVLAATVTFAAILVAGMVTSMLLAFWARSAELEANRQRIAADTAKVEANKQRDEAGEAKAEADKQRNEALMTAYASGMQLAQRAWEENDVVRARELLEEMPKQAGGRNLRGFEWYYLSRLCHSDELTLKGDSDELTLKGDSNDWIMSVAFSPDSQRLASGSSRTVKIWDRSTGKELFAFEGHGASASGLAFSPDSQRLASGGRDNTVMIWDSVTGKELFCLKGHTEWVTSVAFTPDGQRLASGDFDDTIKIWDITTGEELFSLKGEDCGVTSVAFSPDGQRLASGGWREVKIWDSVTGKKLFSLKPDTKHVDSVVFTPDGKRLISGSKDKTVTIWDSATGEKLFSLQGHAQNITSLAFSSDGQRLATGSGDRTVKIWDSATGEELLELKGHTDSIDSVAFSPDGQHLASGSKDGTVKIWDSTTNKEMFALKRHTHRGFPSGSIVAFSPDGLSLATVGWDSTVKIWDSVTATELFSLKRHKFRFHSVAFSRDGLRLAWGGDNNTVEIYDIARSKRLFSLMGHAQQVWNLAFSPDGQLLASGGSGGTVNIWESVTGKELFSLKGGCSSVAFSPDGRRLATDCLDHTLKIWDTATGKELLSLKGHNDGVSSVAFSPDGQRLASGSWDRTVNIWDSGTGEELLSLKGHNGAVMSVKFSPDGQRLASGSLDNTVKIWHSLTGKELFSLKGHSGMVGSVAFSPDGQRLASANGDGSIILWETTTVSPEIQQRRAVNQLVPDLFEQIPLRADVLERLRTLPVMSPSRRQEAIAVAQSYPEDPNVLNKLARELVNQRRGEMSEYRKAVRYVEEACLLEPENGFSLNTLGVAYYRIGDYEKALSTLLRSEPINKAQSDGSIPGDIAFLAMTHHQLGHVKEAQVELQRLRERMKDPRWAQDAEAKGFLSEAEALLGKPKPTGKE